MSEDPREAEVIVARLIERDGRYTPVPSAAYPDPPLAFAALASLARNARKAALAEAVVEAARVVVDKGALVIDPEWAALDEALAAFRAEYPADPQRNARSPGGQVGEAGAHGGHDRFLVEAAMTDPVVSPFDLIREALQALAIEGPPVLIYTSALPNPGPAFAALDQLQRDHEALSEGFKRNLRLATEEIRAERDAAVREAETLLHDLIGDVYPYVRNVATNPDNAPWRRETAALIVAKMDSLRDGGIRAALASSRATTETTT